MLPSSETVVPVGKNCFREMIPSAVSVVKLSVSDPDLARRSPSIRPAEIIAFVSGSNTALSASSKVFLMEGFNLSTTRDRLFSKQSKIASVVVILKGPGNIVRGTFSSGLSVESDCMYTAVSSGK